MITNQYINKRLLLAEIGRRKQDAINNCGGFKSIKEHECDRCIVEKYEEMEDIINSLDVKEVDLEKEIDKFYGLYRKDGKTYSIKDNEECFDWKEDCNPDFEIAFAKHFFELGLKAQKGE